MRKVILGFILLVAGSNAFTACEGFMMIDGISGGSACAPQGRATDFMVATLGSNSFTVTRAIDIASPRLFLACAAGEHLVDVYFKMSGQSYHYRDVLVTDFKQTANPAMETVTFMFRESDVPKTSIGAQLRGSGSAQGVQIAFVNEPPTGQVPEAAWQMNVRNSGKVSIAMVLQKSGRAKNPVGPSVRSSTPPTRYPLACIDLRKPDGGILTRYQLTDVSVSETEAGKNVGFAKILMFFEPNAGLPCGTTPPGKVPVGYDVKANKKV